MHHPGTPSHSTERWWTDAVGQEHGAALAICTTATEQPPHKLRQAANRSLGGWVGYIITSALGKKRHNDGRIFERKKRYKKINHCAVDWKWLKSQGRTG